jgi:spore coat protein A, manganese oxidase
MKRMRRPVGHGCKGLIIATAVALSFPAAWQIGPVTAQTIEDVEVSGLSNSRESLSDPKPTTAEANGTTTSDTQPMVSGADSMTSSSTLSGSGSGSGDDGDLHDVLGACENNSPVGPRFSRPMPIPPTANVVNSPDPSTDTYVITERAARAEIIPGILTPTWGYNGITPGPTILARKGRQVNVTFSNQLPPDEQQGIIIDQELSDDHPFVEASTSVHLHGINADHFSDGYPEDNDTPGHRHRKNPGEVFTHHYPNNEYQRPYTGWYHDHSVHITSLHIYRGLAAFYWLSDPIEDALRLPGSPLADGPGRGYGVFDIPLVLKDVMIDRDSGKLIYNNCSHMGAFGDVMTMNGKQQPFFKVANRKYRFRQLNGSDSRQYLIAIRKIQNVNRDPDDAGANEPFFLIASDQGLFAKPVVTDSFHTTPSERWEFVFDFSRYPVGQRLVMVNLLVDPDDDNGKLFNLMAFDVNRVEADPSQVPPVLRSQAEHPADTQPPSQVRLFEFAKDNGPYWSINGKIFDPQRDDARPLLNTNEDWILDNPHGGWGHPIHIHLGRFRVIDIDGRAPRPGELDGFKDSVWLGPNQRITVRHQFWNFTDRFVFHCHNGSHEDFDMMSQFNVQPGPPGSGM